jgi:predicted Ser/Thr protein kinase
LGPYELIGRLGQGGMGTVYLARGPRGVPVAVKIIRPDLAPDDEFRRRFRSEVNRARQVPPFCTAEVLDADPDHEPPYLVVEYVDGPSLADAVQERGPLTSSNLHGVAIGVATALTAIHGAGVIHRDLKPRNVLLAPGSPKVIDFGIARALEPTSGHTGTGELVGTVAYMAPERFGPEAGGTLTAAADIFAWGGVVAYAGTGRTPFSADSPPATAARILTQPPDLTGLTGPLRDLVRHALEKDPANRPSARELLDLLLATGPQRSPATAAALAHQPGLRAAAQEAQAATHHAPAGQVTAAAVPAQFAGPDGTGPVTAHPDQPTSIVHPAGTGATDEHPPGTDTPLVHPAGDPAQVTQALPAARAFLPSPDEAGPVPGQAEPVPSQGGPVPSQVAPVPTGPDGPPPESRPEPRRRWVLPAALTLLLLAVLIPGLLISTYGPFGMNLSGPPPVDTGPTGVPEDSSFGPPSIEDSLARTRYWRATESVKERADCFFSDGLGLVARRQSPGPFRCPGPADAITADQGVEVGVRLLSRGSCASIWFRFDGKQGYQVRVCDNRILVGWHRSRKAEVMKTFPLDDHVEVGEPPTRIRVAARGDTVEVFRDSEPVGTVSLTDPDIVKGKVILGIYTENHGGGQPPPYSVAFDNVRIWSFGA